jgi:hypothetical protein
MSSGDQFGQVTWLYLNNGVIEPLGVTPSDFRCFNLL